jgi:hypothetical protein
MSIGTGPDRFKPGDAHRRIRMKGEEKTGLALKVFAWMAVIGFSALVALVVGIIARFLWIIFSDE